MGIREHKQTLYELQDFLSECRRKVRMKISIETVRRSGIRCSGSRGLVSRRRYKVEAMVEIAFPDECWIVMVIISGDLDSGHSPYECLVEVTHVVI
jgi:hypothetical protein